MSSHESNVEKARKKALTLMRESGFPITQDIEVVVDPHLPFMGYATRRREGGPVIVVSGMAVKSGLVEGLLIHEMCHVYRTDQKHPSHNSDILNTVGHAIINENQLTEDYQIKLVQQAVNHIQDLYADDISFKVFEKNDIFTQEQAFEFFLDWINDTPVTSKTIKASWLNLGTMLNNCFAISNLTRHGVKDIDNQAENKAQKFLSKVNVAMQQAFTYFRNFMINLEENPTEKQFKQDLSEYLTKIMRLAKPT